MSAPLFESRIAEFPCRRGKVRDIYDLGDRLVIVATDRISAFDWVLPTPIPDKGRILTQMTLFWLDFLKIPNHLITADVRKMPKPFADQADALGGRSMLVRKTEVVPIECVVRGYIAGSGWKEYRDKGTVCGLKIIPGLRECEALPEPIFTPATKAESGHDENISFEQMVAVIHQRLSDQFFNRSIDLRSFTASPAVAQQIVVTQAQSEADELRQRSIDIYRRGAEYAKGRGIILADTKFEWGKLPEGEIILIDEVLTPDSSRFWPLDSYRPGANPPSFDKQFVRDWLETMKWDKNSPPPELPADVVEKTREKYVEALLRLTGKGL